MSFDRQKAGSFRFEGATFEDDPRSDLITNNAVIVEVNAARALHPGSRASSPPA